MTRVNNHRANVKSGKTKHRKSKACRAKDNFYFWKKRALEKVQQEEAMREMAGRVESAERNERVLRSWMGDLQGELGTVQEELEEKQKELGTVQEELEGTKKELNRQNKAYAALDRKVRKEKNDMLNKARERYKKKERELIEKHEQQVSELVGEIEIQEEGRMEAEDKIREMEMDMEDVYVELFGENLFL